MPMPKPKDDESKEDFVSRCMSDEVMKKDYADNDQRLAICNGLWDKKEKKLIAVIDNSEPPVAVEVKTSNEIEKRFTGFIEHRITEDEDGRKHITGYVTVYNQLSDPIFNFRERIIPGAFTESLSDKSYPKKSYFNHDPSWVLGNTENDTVSFTENDLGIYVDAIPPDTSMARDAIEMISGRYVNHASFAFRVNRNGDRYLGEPENLIREIMKGKFYEGGPVSDAAYPQTTANLRNMYRNLGVNILEMRTAVAKYHLGIDLTNDELGILKRTTDLIGNAINNATDSGESEAEAIANAERMGKVLRKLDLIERLYC